MERVAKGRPNVDKSGKETRGRVTDMCKQDGPYNPTGIVFGVGLGLDDIVA